MWLIAADIVAPLGIALVGCPFSEDREQGFGVRQLALGLVRIISSVVSYQNIISLVADQAVAAQSADQDVITTTTLEFVLTGTTQQDVIASAAFQLVLATATIYDRADSYVSGNRSMVVTITQDHEDAADSLSVEITEPRFTLVIVIVVVFVITAVDLREETSVYANVLLLLRLAFSLGSFVYLPFKQADLKYSRTSVGPSCHTGTGDTEPITLETGIIGHVFQYPPGPVNTKLGITTVAVFAYYHPAGHRTKIRDQKIEHLSAILGYCRTCRSNDRHIRRH